MTLTSAKLVTYFSDSKSTKRQEQQIIVSRSCVNLWPFVNPIHQMFFNLDSIFEPCNCCSGPNCAPGHRSNFQNWWICSSGTDWKFTIQNKMQINYLASILHENILETRLASRSAWVGVHWSNTTGQQREQEQVKWKNWGVRRGAIYRQDSFVLMLCYCANLKAIRYESTTLNGIVADKWHRVIVA